MKIRRKTLLLALLTAFLTITLNSKIIHSIPPLCRLLDPFHGVWQNAETSKIQLPKSLECASLKAPVKIYLDKRGVPSIEAEQESDLYFAQGYITAFHRLWQMDFQTRAGVGRISEIIGSDAIDYDRRRRRMGIADAAQKIVVTNQNDSDCNCVIQSYTDGINAYINTLKYKDYPIEYKLMDYDPESWSYLKTAIMGELMIESMAWHNSKEGDNSSLTRTNAWNQLGKKKFDFLYPCYSPKDCPVIPKGTLWNFKPIKVNVVPFAVSPEYTDISDYTKENQESMEHSATKGSNAWIIGGNRTVSGRPYLVNDTHLKMKMPSTWYVIQLKAPGVKTAGFSIPGIPGVFIGFNEHIAWGITSGAHDVMHWYSLEYVDDTRETYRYDGKDLKVQFVKEEIKVRWGNSFYDTIRKTHFGPVLYDETFHDCTGKGNLAMRWLGHNPGKELRALYNINRAKTVEEVDKALLGHNIPILNVHYASVHGDIGIRVAGQLALLTPGNGRFILPGNDSRYELQGFVPKNHNPVVRNPKCGYLSSANQRSTDKSYPYAYYHRHSIDHYRSRRINQLLEQNDKVTEQYMMEMQNDIYNLVAAENLPFLLQKLDEKSLNTTELDAYQTLKSWNMKNEINLRAPSIWSAWYNAISNLLWKPLRLLPYRVDAPTLFRTLEIIREDPFSEHIDLGEFKNMDSLIQKAFLDAVTKIVSWESQNKKTAAWSYYRKFSIKHLAQISTFGQDYLPIGGGKYIINTNEENLGASIGVSMRLIVSLEDNPKAWVIYPGGQSGNPGSAYYNNLTQSWIHGEYFTMGVERSEQEKKGNALVVLNPKK